MSLTVTEIERHEPFPDPKVAIIFDDDTGLTLGHFTTTEIYARHVDGSIFRRCITDDLSDINSILNDISEGLPDYVERTARRILQLGEWLETQDLTRSKDSFLKVTGTYRPLRREQNQLYLVQEANYAICNRALPFVVSLQKPNQNPNQIIKRRINQELRKLTFRTASSFRIHHFKKDQGRAINVTKFQKVESLKEAERIVNGEPRNSTNDSPSDETATEQLSLTQF